MSSTNEERKSYVCKPLAVAIAVWATILSFHEPPCLAATRIVTNTAYTGAGSLQQTIMDAASGDTITFDPAVTGTIHTGVGFTIDKNLTIVGPGPKVLTLSADTGTGNIRVIDIEGGLAGVYVTISGLTIANGRMTGGSGAGILCRYAWLLTLENCVISNNVAGSFYTYYGSGGGLSVYSSTLAMQNCTVVSNSAWNGGGLLLAGSSGMNSGFAHLTNCTFAYNYASEYGGGIKAQTNTTLSMQHCTISGNVAQMGGGFYKMPGNSVSVALANTIVAGNSGAYMGDSTADTANTVLSGGYNLIGNGDGSSGWQSSDLLGTSAAPLDAMLGPLQDNTGSTPTMRPLAGSPAIDAGRAGNTTTDQRGRPRPYDDPLVANAASGDGSDIGAVEIGPANLLVTQLGDSGDGSLRQTIANASDSEADVISFAPGLSGTITLGSGELSIAKSVSINGPGPKSVAVSGGGASRVFNVSGSSVFISGLKITGGLAGTGGGVYLSAGTLELRNCEISGNQADTASGGAGVRNAGGTLSIYNCTLWGNINETSGDANGGGLYSTTGTVKLFNSTISGNDVSTYGSGICAGGGIAVLGGRLDLTSCTIAYNRARGSNGGGGGVAVAAGVTCNCVNNIIAYNSAARVSPDAGGTFKSKGFNLILDPSGSVGFEQPSDHRYEEPMLGPLSDYGGPTPTHALMAGSAAIDQGTRGSLSTDQRGFARTIDSPAIANGYGDGTDIGAYEADIGGRIASIQRAGGDITLAASTQLGRNYAFYYSSDAGSTSWTPLGSSMPGTGYLLWITDPNGGTQSRRFYRAVELP